MTRNRFGTAALVLNLLVLLGVGIDNADLVPQAVAADASAQTGAIQPGMARVWFVRPAGSLNGNVWAAAPVVYANGAPVGKIAAGTDFFRDFPFGTYKFTVLPYGLPTGQSDTVELVPGTQTYLEIEWIGSWEAGYAEGGWGFAPNSFGVLTMSPQLARAYLPTLAYRPQ
jgi:hypothetical protein